MVTDTDVTKAPAPGRPGLSFEVYQKAYHELCAPDGTPPSQRQLRKFLGTGSNTTLASYRRRIAKERAVDQLQPEAGSIDGEILKLIQSLAAKIAIDEAQVAEDRVAEIQKEAEQQVRIAQTTMEKRLRDTALLEYRANTAETTINEQKNTLSEQKDRQVQLESDLQSSRESVTALKRSLESTTKQLATLKQQHSTLQRTLDEVRENGKIEQAKYQANIDNVAEKLNDTKRELASAKEQCTGLVTRADDRDKLIKQMSAQQNEVQQRFEQVDSSRESTLVQLEDARQIIIDLKVQLGTRDAELAAEKNAHENNKENLETEKRLRLTTIAQLESTIDKQSAHIERLDKMVAKFT